MFLCCNVACAARGNVHSCGTSRAHSSCDTRDTLLWGHSLGHLALIRTPGIPWLMRFLVSCDNPYPLLSQEAAWSSETKTRPHEEHLQSRYTDNIRGISKSILHFILHFWHEIVSWQRHKLRIGVWDRDRLHAQQSEEMRDGRRKWEKLGKDYVSGLGQRFPGDEKTSLSSVWKVEQMRRFFIRSRGCSNNLGPTHFGFRPAQLSVVGAGVSGYFFNF